MRILWLVSTPLTPLTTKPMIGCGWLDALRIILEERYPDIQLGIASVSTYENQKTIINGTTYYNIKYPTTDHKLNRLINNWRLKQNDKKLLNLIFPTINDFSPDLIHIHGTESMYGLLFSQVKIPIIISIQGILQACYPYSLFDISIFNSLGRKH